MTRRGQTREDLIQHLREQVRFLGRSGTAFDEGDESESKRLATSIRNLIHDSPRTTSVLLQLGVKSTVRFLDTSLPLPLAPPGSITLSFGGLAILRMGSGVKYAAELGEYDRETRNKGYQPFRRWWTFPVLSDNEGHDFTRRDLVLGLAQMDGGTHVDPELEAAYAALSRSNSMRMQWSEGEQWADMGSPVPANVRQIAWELETSIKGQLGDLLAVKVT